MSLLNSPSRAITLGNQIRRAYNGFMVSLRRSLVLVLGGCLLCAQALGQAKPGILLDFAALAKGGKPAFDRMFGKPLKTVKHGAVVEYIYRPKNFRKVSAYTDKTVFGFGVEYKPKDNKDWKSILAQLGLSVSDRREVYNYFHWMTFIKKLNEIPHGVVTINRERVKKSEKYTGWVEVSYDSRDMPSYN